ncbi:unnamed protein product [Staurois parvus]|uniref:Uncharacterized protein n=1 Tax=Staurois parvus TaxID=386267 RepID=A0ABN9CWV2_9NEOB|nr:unnamed protein product [Staurois parvus]
MFTIQFSPLSAPAHCFVWLCIAGPYKAEFLQWKAQTQPHIKKHTQHTVTL